MVTAAAAHTAAMPDDGSRAINAGRGLNNLLDAGAMQP
jgi:hypothetical protein